MLTYLSVVLLSKYEGFTLTLAGIAGLIVAIGITADSFIVYFERLRDEVREGRSLRTAVERGWSRARRTILVSDTVSFLAALLLYILSIGDVRGFAFTLGLTTLIDVIVVFLFTKPMVTLLARTKFYGQGHKLSGLDPARLGARAPWRGGRRPAPSSGRHRRHRIAQLDQYQGGVMSRLGNLGGRLYRGEVSIDFVNRQKLWYTISGFILVISLVALIFRGLNFSVEFKGGSLFTVPAATSVTQTGLEQVVTASGGTNPSVTEVKPFNGKAPYWQVQTSQLSTTKSLAIERAIAQKFDLNVNNLSIQTVGSSWGSQVSQKAFEALIAFLIVIVIYLSIAFEWRMAAAAFVALAHDIVITIGVYALTGFQVSPATVIGLLTILGYSLYDTVVVFDKVRENTAPILGTRKSTYSQSANLALNQTLVRSINTSLTALLPVAAILVVGTLLLGNGELKDLSLVLFVGMLSGTYSSIFIATPVLADLKEREPQYKQLAKQVALRAAGGRAALRKARPAVAGATAGAAGSAAGNGGASGNGGATAVGVAERQPDRGGRRRRPRPGRGRSTTSPCSAAQPAAGGQARGASQRPPGARQQPVRRSAAKRRPSGKKKRR